MESRLQFSVKTQIPERVQYHVQPSIASNGKHMYILLGKSLFKIGTGFNGTLKGYVYAVNPEFCKEKNGWIGFCGVSSIFSFIIFRISLSKDSQTFFSVSEFAVLQENIKTEQ